MNNGKLGSDRKVLLGEKLQIGAENIAVSLELVWAWSK
jgi:hypothetical protein